MKDDEPLNTSWEIFNGIAGIATAITVVFILSAAALGFWLRIVLACAGL